MRPGTQLTVHLLVLVLAASSGASHAASRPPVRTDSLVCDLDTAIFRPLASSPLLLLGEIHGTDETPRFLGEHVCGLLRDGRAVIVGLEIPDQHRPAFESFLASTGDGLVMGGSMAPGYDGTLWLPRATPSPPAAE